MPTNTFFENIEQLDDPEAKALANKIKNIRATEYDQTKENMYTTMIEQIDSIRKNTFPKIATVSTPFPQLMRQAGAEIKDTIQQQYDKRLAAISNQQAFTMAYPRPASDTSAQSWLSLSWLRNQGSNLWKSAAEKVSQAKSYAASYIYIPQSIQDRVGAWSETTQLAVFSALAGALIAIGYYKDFLIQIIQNKK